MDVIQREVKTVSLLNPDGIRRKSTGRV